MPPKPASSAARSHLRQEIDAIKRQGVLDEASRQFFALGYENASLDSIAEALGVSKPFIYSRFASKNEILVALCRFGSDSALATIEFAGSLDGEPASRLGAVMAHFCELQIERRQEVALIFREVKNIPPEVAAEIDSAKASFHQMLREILQEGIAAGQFAVSDISLTASAIGGMASWTYTWFQPSGRMSAQEVARNVAGLALRTAGVSDPDRYLVASG